MVTVPPHLRDYADLYARDKRAASLEWFAAARFGLFIHYGLYAALGRGEWVMARERIPLDEYAKLRDTFTAERFDAEFIADVACEAEMKYVNLVTCHHDSFCLWNSKVEPFNSVKSPCGRDLVGEMASACQKRGLGFFVYYTYGVNWRHPKYMSRDYFPMARPDYATPEPRYTFRGTEDFPEYMAYVHEAIAELLTGYGPLAGVWLDLIMAYYAQPDLFPVEQTYAQIRRTQPHALVAFKQGATGDEDFATPERHFHSLAPVARERFGERAGRIAEAAWERNRTKHNEICTTLQDGWWGYSETARHLSADETIDYLAHAAAHNCNLLLNIGPLPDGSVHPQDVATLREVGRRIRHDGWPAPRSKLPEPIATPSTDAPPAA